MAKKKWVVDLDMGQNEVQNAVVQNLASAPSTPKEGQQYWNTADKKWYIYDGSNWVDATNQGKTYTFTSGITEGSSNVVTLDKATVSAIGGVIIGSNVSVAADGTISVADASTSGKGVIEIATDGECTTGTSETLAVNPKQLATKVDKLTTGPTAGTYTKVTINADGLVTTGTTLAAADIPDISATYVTQTQIGVANGVAGLDNDGKVPSSQLPSYVDDVVELLTLSDTAPVSCATGDKYYNTSTKKIYTATATDTWDTTGVDPDTGVIYVALDTDASYRWSGSAMINIGNPIGAATESTPGIAALATQAEVDTGTNDTKIVTPLKLATLVQGMAKKFATNNTALTASGGVCTWNITNSLGTADVGVHVYEVSTGDEVMTSVTVASGTITIKINSASDIAADTYRAVVIG